MIRRAHRPRAAVPGRDPAAVRHPADPGSTHVREPRRVAVIGGGIAGVAAAAVLAERGVDVVVLERDDRLGGRVAAWPLGDGRTMSRGFHAFFRQYYNLRALLRRADPALERLVPIADYPLERPGGPRDSFARIPRTPPWSVLGFVLRSPTFTPLGLARVNVPAALELLQTVFPGTHERYEGESAAAFLDRLRFPHQARDLALEVFARSFFADPREFAAGELVSMFHSYFLGSAEGLLFDVPDDDYDTALWRPLADYLRRVDVDVRLDSEVVGLDLADRAARITLADGSALESDAVVLAADPAAARRLIAAMPGPREHALESEVVEAWRADVAATRNAPPFVVVRLWFDGLVDPQRAPFLGTSGYGPLDNISVLERFEAGARAWSEEHDGSVVELHAYACDPAVAAEPDAAATLVAQLETALHRAYPECAALGVRHREVLVRDDCTLIEPVGWSRRPGVRTPVDRLVLAGDWVRTEHPVALMERAASTGFQAANALLVGWGVRGVDLWTTPVRGLLGPEPAHPLSPSGAEPGAGGRASGDGSAKEPV